MARSIPQTPPSTPDITSINLTRLLSRLEHNLLSPSADTKLLLHSPYHRTRVGANIEYARTLLLHLEHNTSSIKIQSRKAAAKADLLQKRGLIKRLNERLEELGREAEAGLSDDEDDEEREDLLGEENGAAGNGAVEATMREDERNAGRDTDLDGGLDRRKEGAATTDLDPESGPTALRNRRLGQPSQMQEGDSTKGTTTGTDTRRTEALLTHNRNTQESLADSLTSMAAALKQSSLAFATTLEGEKPMLARAGEGLERNTTGMEAAGKRMGMLRRMSEGRGWWGRMLMYAWIFGLWVVAVLLVFVGPKLRF